MKTDISPTFLNYQSNMNTDMSVLLQPFQSSWIIVNEPAKIIITMMAAGHKFETIAQFLVQNYDIKYAHALDDIHLVEQTLQKNNFEISQITPKVRKPSLKSLFIHITKRCNLHCPHCYAVKTKSNEEMPTSSIIALIDTLIEQDGDSLTISGGEPLLHPEIKSILSHASKKLSVRLLTNGTLINRKMAIFLAEHKIYVQISLDGATPLIHDAIRGEGTYERVIKAIQLLQDAGAGDRLNLCTTLMEKNANDWQELIAFAENKNIPLLRFLHLREIGRAGNNPSARPLTSAAYENFIAHLNQMQFNRNQKVELTCGMSGLLLKMPEPFKKDDIWCPVGRMMVIDTNGNVYPCVLMMRDQFFLGNIFSQSLLDISQSKKMHDICQLLSNRRYIIQKCKGCTFRNLCQAGCMGQALDHSNNLMETDIFCSYRKKAYKAAFDRLVNNLIQENVQGQAQGSARACPCT